MAERREAAGGAAGEEDLLGGAEAVVAPFGSNTANAVFMRPGSVFVEVTPLCASTCTEGCHPYSKTASGSMSESFRGAPGGVPAPRRAPRLKGD